MRVTLRHFLLDREGTLYRLPNATLDRMLQIPARHRLPRLAGQRVRSAEVAVETMNGRPLRVVRSVFDVLTFKRDGRWYRHYGIATYGPAPNWRWRSGHRPAMRGLPKPVLGLSLEAVNGHRRRLSRDGSSKPRWGVRNAPEYRPPDPESNDRSTRSLGVVQNHNRPGAEVDAIQMIAGKRPFSHSPEHRETTASLRRKVQPPDERLEGGLAADRIKPWVNLQ